MSKSIVEAPLAVRPLHVFLSCFDVSGDHHGADFIRYVRKHYPGKFVFSALAGQEVRRLQALVDDDIAFLEDTVTSSSIGIVEGVRYVFSSLGLYTRIKKTLQRCNLDRKIPNPFALNKRNLAKHKKDTPEINEIESDPLKLGFGKVDLFLCVDGQGRNFALASLARKMGCKTAYYFPPPVFIWGKWNTAKLRAFDLVLTVFKPNQVLLKKGGVKTVFVGHPFVQTLSEKKMLIPTGEKSYLISLFPGSRFQEIKSLLPLFLETVVELNQSMPMMRYKVSLSHQRYLALAKKLVANACHKMPENADFLKTIEFEYGRWDELLYSSRFVFCCSGTVTLKAALLGIPHVIVYRIGSISAFIAKRLVYVKHIGIANILFNKEVTREFINSEASVQALKTEAQKALFSASLWRKKSRELKSVKQFLEGKKCLDRLAQALLSTRGDLHKNLLGKKTRSSKPSKNKPFKIKKGL